MPPFFRCWFYLILCIFMYGCSLMPNEIKTAERVMETNPDSALHILQHVHTDKLMLSSADRALYGLLLFQALDKNSQPLQPDSAINFSVNYYQDINDKPHLAKSYFYKAKVYKKAQRFDDATVLYLKALDLIQDKNYFVLLGKIYSDMGDICSFQLDYKESLKKYQKAIECFNKAGDTIDACYKVIDIGRVYCQLKDYKKAQLYYRQSLLQTSDSILKGSAYQGLGINCYRAQQYDSAQFFLRRSLHLPYKGTNYAIRCFTLADLFFDQQKYDSALVYATKALRYPSTFYIQRDCYRILANSEYSRKDLKQMAFYMSKYQDCTDSVRKIEIQTKTSVLEDLHQTNGEFSKSKHFLVILGCIIPLIILFSFFLVYRLKDRNKGKEKLLEQAEKKLILKQVLLRDSLIQKIEENKMLQAARYKKSPIAQRELIDREIYNVCLHVNEWDAFKTLMDKTFNNLISTLESNYPDINHKEMTWCCLSLLNVPTPDMTVVLECQPGSLYKLKQRMTQKMNLTGTKELDQFLRNLSGDK